MATLKEGELTFLKKYNELLNSMDEGFTFLSEVTDFEDATISTVFADLVHAFQQLNVSHEQLISIIEWNDFSPFQKAVEAMSTWFETAEENKQELVTNHIIPAFQAWRRPIQLKLNQYLQH
ncbi:hypothetical protein [Salirhabdus salicampi]|uniref:hypothetical protein n=1 Tax=Salirhabdus salicampi TaxID=476102 RepID=UPI0020C1DE4A|nr:hypothetical protein [Salirhabdus salicampi]MCP8617610.1 hypothetical protein [Salirhabdus salicampi]